VKETRIEKRQAAPLQERAQYALAFGVIALMLYLAGFPLFLLFFVGVLTFFVWKVFSSERRNDTRRIFEFYLSANEILRDDDRRWYGFEIQDAVARGEAIVKSMSAAPPLVEFALGALYQKLGDHASARTYLASVVEKSEEIKLIFPTKELRDYVRVLRKIERAPAEAPLTSAAIRSLERARRNRAEQLLASSEAQLADAPLHLEDAQNTDEIRVKRRSIIDISEYRDEEEMRDARSAHEEARMIDVNLSEENTHASEKTRGTNPPTKDRKTISEVLHDIYDTNIG
jgi:hypothetical protein